MAAKSIAEPSAKSRHSRRREIGGILLLAGGLFTGLSLLSMHVGGDPLMGPGGDALASGTYGLVGVTGYLFIAAFLVASVRCFRGRPLVDGFREGLGVPFLLSAVATLLYLPFADSEVSMHGPGGMLGEALGELIGAGIGAVGAALAATTMLVIGLLMVTEISTREAYVVVGWALRHAGRGIVAGARAAWRVTRAAFPEKDDTGERARARDAHDDEAVDAAGDDAHDERATEEERIAIVEPVRAALTAAEAAAEEEGVPQPMPAYESEGVRVGAARTVSDEVSAERAAMRAIVAEMAAAERLPEAESEEEDTVEAVIEVPPPPPDAPIIVESASQRLRREEEAAEAFAASEKAATKTAEEKQGFIKLGEGAFRTPGTDLLEYIPPQTHDTDKQQLYDMAERLEQAMSNYGVRGKVKEIHMGPVVTMYEFAPAPGTRTGKIANLENDLAMALEAQAVRIVAPIPGKAVVGVEVPNKTRETVYLKEILAGRAASPAPPRSCRSRSARTSRGRRSASTCRRCRTCWSPAPPARASRSRSTG